MSISIRVVDHPSLGQTRKAIALVVGGQHLAYLHNDFSWHDWSYLHCPKMFAGTSAAQLFIILERLADRSIHLSRSK